MSTLRGRSGTGAAGGRAAERRGGGDKVQQEIVQLCAFLVGDECYAVDIMPIKEIINPLAITRIPRAPAFMEGVIALRGAILPVVDLRKRFDLAPTPFSRASKFLIVAAAGGGGDRFILGLVVDKVLEVIRIPRDEIQRPPVSAGDEATRYLAGVCRHRGRIVMVLDLEGLLSPFERTSLADLGQGLPSLPFPVPPLGVPIERRGKEG